MIRFQADADLNRLVLRAVRRLEPDIDFQTAAEARLAGLEDREVLALAADAGRLLVTHDQKTMPSHFGRFVAERTSPGVVIIPQHLPIASAAEGLLRIWSASDAGEWVNRIFWLRHGLRDSRQPARSPVGFTRVSASVPSPQADPAVPGR